MGKSTFTIGEYNELRILISKKVVADKSGQKKIRDQIRKLGFHFSDYSSKKGYDVDDFENLIGSGQIVIQQKPMTLSPEPTLMNENQKLIEIPLIGLTDPFESDPFCHFSQLSPKILGQTGLYCIKIKDKSIFPKPYRQTLCSQSHNVIYIGKAEDQSLRTRLNQEVYHTRPGTFFRGIGAVLGYRPVDGHLKGMCNTHNYQFCKEDTDLITQWLLKHTEFCILPLAGDFSLEKKMIKKYCPILNTTHNPQKSAHLANVRKECRAIALGLTEEKTLTLKISNE